MFCVCYTCDNNYALQVGVAIYSLYENNQDLDALDTVVFSDRISADNQQKLLDIAKQFGRKLSFVESEKIIEYIKDKGIIASVDDGALSTYVRLFIGSYIDDKYDRLIYIDADTITLESLRELTEVELKKPVAAVIDIMPEEYKQRIGFQNDYYFNCGVLVIDMIRWKKGNYESRLLQRVEQTIGKFMFGDQDVFNVVLKGDIQVLPLQYNFFPFYGEIQYENLIWFIGGKENYYSKEQFAEAGKQPAIIHLVYSVADRPWMKGNLNHFQDRWREYVAKTPWKTYTERSRKVYSRTKIHQLIYKIFGEKAVLMTEKRRHMKKIKAWEKSREN